MGTSKGNLGRRMYNDPKWRKAISDKMLYPRILVRKVCPKCKSIFQIERKIDKKNQEIIKVKEKKFCSRKCANSRCWDTEHKKKQSEKLKRRITKSCPICFIVFETTLSRNKKYCSHICRGKSVQKNNNSLTEYRKRCAFKFNLLDYKDFFNFNLIKKFGWYKAKNHGNNLTGISRDHKISIVYGYQNDISPEIISHPANCQLLPHNQNVSKGSKCDITLEELVLLIKKWDNIQKKGGENIMDEEKVVEEAVETPEAVVEAEEEVAETSEAVEEETAE